MTTKEIIANSDSLYISFPIGVEIDLGMENGEHFYLYRAIGTQINTLSVTITGIIRIVKRGGKTTQQNTTTGNIWCFPSSRNIVDECGDIAYVQTSSTFLGLAGGGLLGPYDVFWIYTK